MLEHQNSTSTAFTLPVAVAKSTFNWGWCSVYNNGANQTTPGNMKSTASSTTINVYKSYITTPWTGSGGKAFNFGVITYEID